jgi:hypothetical protein
VRAVVGAERWSGSHSVGPFSVPIMGWTDEYRGFVVEAYYEDNRSVIATQTAFRTRFAFCDSDTDSVPYTLRIL